MLAGCLDEVAVDQGERSSGRGQLSFRPQTRHFCLAVSVYVYDVSHWVEMCHQSAILVTSGAAVAATVGEGEVMPRRIRLCLSDFLSFFLLLFFFLFLIFLPHLDDISISTNSQTDDKMCALFLARSIAKLFVWSHFKPSLSCLFRLWLLFSLCVRFGLLISSPQPPLTSNLP